MRPQDEAAEIRRLRRRERELEERMRHAPPGAAVIYRQQLEATRMRIRLHHDSLSYHRLRGLRIAAGLFSRGPHGLGRPARVNLGANLD